MNRSSRPGGQSAGELTPVDFTSAVTAISAAFGDPTRRDIYLFVRQSDGGVTASETALRFNLHPNVARHHLDKLVAGGYVEVGTDRAERAVGRPSKRYRVNGEHAAAALSIEFPVRHDDVLITLLGRALAKLPREAAEQLAEEVGVEYGRAMAASIGDKTEIQRSFRSALHAVAGALTAHGFAAHAEKRNGKLRIVSEHCPFGEAVIEHPVICAVDRGMVKGMLESLWGSVPQADIDASLPMGDDKCVTTIADA